VQGPRAKLVTMFRKNVLSLGLSVAALISAHGCRRYVFEFQPKSQKILRDIELTVDRPSEADVLFVIDSSGSMAQHQENLRRNISAYIDNLSTSPNKFQIAVTTTDLNDCTEIPPAGNPWDGKCGRLLSPDGQDPIIRRVDYADNVALAERFRAIAGAVGTKGSGYEQGLKAAARAVDPELTGAGKPNSGFVRPGALLMVVILSDESDCSYAFDQQSGYSQFIGLNLEAGESCYKFRDKLEPANAWADRISTVKGRRALGAVCAITAGQFDEATRQFTAGNCVIDANNQPSNACTCFLNQSVSFCQYPFPDEGLDAQRQPPPGQTGGCGPNTTCCTGNSCCIAMADDRYVSFADNFRLRFKDSICRGEYRETLNTCAEITKRDCFPLAQGPADDREDYVTVRRKLAGETEWTDVPQVPSSVNFAGNGWFLFTDKETATGETVSEICLAGEYKRVIGDTYNIKVFVESTGDGSDIPADAAK
jgi:hypothetical protein